MSSVASLFQAVLFAGLNISVLAYAGDVLSVEYNIISHDLPRILVYHGCMCMVLGFVFLESISVRYDQAHGPIVGPMGTFLASWAALYACAITAFFSAELVLMVPVAFAVAFSYGRAKFVNHSRTEVQMVIASLILTFGLVVLLVDSQYVDDFTDEFAQFVHLESREALYGFTRRPSYLTEMQGVFASPLPAVIYTSVACLGLMWAQLPPSKTSSAV